MPPTSPSSTLSHLAQGLPHAPGVYLFWGEEGGLPLYIGKSVDVRSRVMAHLRAPDEVAMMGRTQRIECIPTAGEVGALLLEAHLIKQMSPLFNVRLRRLRQLLSIRLEASSQGLSPQIKPAPLESLGAEPGWFGLFSSRHAAVKQLESWADEHRLCRELLGLEASAQSKAQASRGCFGWQLKRCAGACWGQEPRQAHDERLRAALEQAEVLVWPRPQAVEVVEQLGDWEQRHRVWRWRHLGTWCSRRGWLAAEAWARCALPANASPESPSTHATQPDSRPKPAKTELGALPFDLDSYKILLRPILQGDAKLVWLDQAQGG